MVARIPSRTMGRRSVQASVELCAMSAALSCGVVSCCADMVNPDGPSCESIDDRQDVRMSVGCWQWSDKVHVDVLKTTSWERETRWGCQGMSMDLALLTRKTFSSPCSDVLVHVGP